MLNTLLWKRTLLLLLLTIAACSISLAQGGGKAEPLRIEFKRGANGMIVSGKVRGTEEAEYLLAARKGQKLIIKLTSVPRRSSVFDLKAPDNADLEGAFDRMADFFERAGLSEQDLMAELASIRQSEFANRFPRLA